MNVRALEILINMLSSNNFIDLETLTKKHQVSERTIYSDFVQIESFLSEYGENLLEREGKKFKIRKMSKVTKGRIENQIRDLNMEIREFSPSSRIEYQIFLLINSFSYVTNQFLADELEISQSTIKNDRSSLQSKLLPYNLMLESKKFKGIRIVGDEENKRAILVDQLIENIKKDDIIEYDPFYLKFLNQELFDDSNHLIGIFTKELSINYTDEALVYLRTALLVTFLRLNNGNTLSTLCTNEVSVKEMSVSRGFKVVKEFVDSRYSKEISETALNREVNYLLAIFDRSSYLTSNYILHSDYWMYYQFLINKLITDVSKTIDIDLMMDEELFISLYNHLHPAIERLKNNTPYTNPLIDEVLENYSKLYHVTKMKLQKIEEYFHVQFNPDETSYVVLLFESAIERNTNEMVLPSKVILVCQFGISTSALLKEELNKHFNVKVTTVLSKKMFLNQMNELDFDYVISTVKLPSNIAYTLVNPILTTADKNILREKLYSKQNLLDANYILNKLSDVITINNYEEAVNRINEIFNEQKSKVIGGEIMLIDVVSESLIQTGFQAKSAEDAVRKAGELLFDNHLVEEKYIDAMVDNLEVNGPYFVIAPGIAMPHARPEYGVNQIGLSIVVLDEAVEFNHPLNDPVKLIIGLCAIDHQSHLNALAELMDILSDNEKVEKIMESKNNNEILNILRGE